MKQKDKYHITEINCVNKDGFIYATTHPSFMDYDMSSGKQSAEFMVLLNGSHEYAQAYQPTSHDPTIMLITNFAKAMMQTCL